MGCRLIEVQVRLILSFIENEKCYIDFGIDQDKFKSAPTKKMRGADQKV